VGFMFPSAAAEVVGKDFYYSITFSICTHFRAGIATAEVAAVI